MARKRYRTSARRAALRFNPQLSWEQRHRNRRLLANLAGCRAYARDRLALLGVTVWPGSGHRWRFLRGGAVLANWLPGPAELKLSDGTRLHCHDVIQVEHELRTWLTQLETIAV